MKIQSVCRGGRPGVWAWAALVVLLAALMHLLACAHGPVPDGAGRADTIAATSAVATHGATTPSPDGSRDADGDARCRGMDEPTAQPPRDRTAAETVRSAPTAEPHLSSPVPTRERAPAATHHSECSPQRERARLGVWRT
ncbi:hypothetical protein [Streptomyces sp. NPDC057694]|uniref:hypothetical protein n=1 Tax=Streptomyces sp. NPDC057694 TaxID=3346216 RepID=UPI0036CE0046